MRRRRLLVLGAIGLSAGAAATAGALSAIGGSATESSPGFVPIQQAHATGPSVGQAGIDADSLDGILQQLVARLGDDRVASADVHSLPTTASNAGGETAVLTVDAAGPGASAIRATWEGELVAGALRDAAAEKHFSGLDNFEVSVHFADGTLVPSDSGFGNVVRSQLFDASPTPLIERRIRSGLADVGLKPVSIGFVSVLQPAPVVVAEADDPTAIVKASEDARWWSKMLGDYDNYEGYYVELRDAAGDAFAISTAAHRAGSSSGWIRPDLNPHQPLKPIATGSDGG
jgi:hypothetical protein